MPEPLLLLLDVQGHDLAADQLRHRRASLPERQALTEADAAVRRLDAELAGLRDRLADLQRSQKRFEDEVATVEEKGAAENQRLYSGSVTAPRELQALQDEIAVLARRQRELEDELLEVMEAVEPLVGEIAGLEVTREELLATSSTLQAEIVAAEAAIDDELATVEGERGTLAGQLDPSLLATYEKLRAQLGGVGVARLEGTQCTGCHLSLPATELDAVRHAGPGGVVYHEECGRILVR